MKKKATTSADPIPKYRIGLLVRFRRRNGAVEEGRVAGTDDRSNGRWVSVNTGGRGDNAVLTSVRPSQLEIV